MLSPLSVSVSVHERATDAHCVKCCFVTALALVVLQGASLLQLKRVIQRAVELKHKREGAKQGISW